MILKFYNQELPATSKKKPDKLQNFKKENVQEVLKINKNVLLTSKKILTVLE